jgi:D-beta-D-heptose 7-phosphate kinase/D-beta-D-heptose 1-phosphate adenosyltransferase
VSAPPLLVVGDALLDRDVDGTVERLSPDAPVPVLDERSSRARPGGAALAALLAGGDGHAVTLVTALGDDPAGRELRELLARAGVDLVDVGLDGRTPEKIRLRAEDRPLLRVDRGGGAPRPARAAARAALAAGDAILVADYGRGMASLDGVRDAVATAAAAGRPVVWDPHPRGPAPVPGVTLATPNAAEARRFAGLAAADDLHGAIACAETLVARWGAGHVCVTCGALGAVLAGGDRPAAVLPAAPAPGGDPCGAGDRFAATATAFLADGALPSEAVAGAVAAASAFVANGGAATVRLDPATPGGPAGSATPGMPEPAPSVQGPPNREGSRRVGSRAAVVHNPPAGPATPEGDPIPATRADPIPATLADPATPATPASLSTPNVPDADGGSPLARALRLIAAVRAEGGTVVATGGCFDLLHAGHVATLRAARALGDCLVVCLNSDASVRRLKGPGRPLVPEADRVAVLEALGCVDVVVPFDERTPEAVLARLRPDVFAKGGDYALTDLPEAALLATWGGQAVVLPYLEGRSTTQLMKEVVRRDSH